LPPGPTGERYRLARCAQRAASRPCQASPWARQASPWARQAGSIEAAARQRQIVAGAARRPGRGDLEGTRPAGKRRPAQMVRHPAVETLLEQAIEGMGVHVPLQHATLRSVKE